MPEWVRTRLLPCVVWGGTMVAAAWLWQDVRRESAVGFALGVEYTVAPSEAGRLGAVAVAPGQRVRAGDVVASLDAHTIDAERVILGAERDRLEAELVAVRSESSVRLGDSTREFDESVENAELALRSAKAERTVRAAEFKALAAQSEALEALVAQRMADRRELDALTVKHAALAKELQMADTLVAQLASQGAAARARRALVPSDATELALQPVRAELAVLSGQEQLLAVRRAGTLLRAPADGEVMAVHLHPGEVAAAGAAVVTIVSRGPGVEDEVQVCLSEAQAGQVRLGEAVNLLPRGASGVGFAGRVSRLGPQISELPLRCRRNPAIPEWGREVAVALDERMPLLPGQAFSVAFLGRPSEHVPPAAAAEAVAEPRSAAPVIATAPTPIDVPPELAARTRFEPSAIAWSASRERFVIASDDTGTPGHDEHAPWLFTMDGRGQVDPEPLVIAGLAGFSDIEAIAAGPGDSMYLLASQSFSRKGKRNPARQVFARVVIDRAGARTEAAIKLADRLDAGGADVLATLGLPDTRGLDLEGLTATAGGGLLIGLKEPLGADGHAVIWALARPGPLLASGDVAGSGLGRWGSISLSITADGAAHPAGISELLELPDGSLLIAGTASGAEPTSQDGALWHASGRDGLASPRRLRSFPGLKPEGLALRPDGAAIVIVFDTGAAPPQWMELPWPAP